MSGPIDLQEKFPDLGNDAPIVEAVLNIHTVPSIEWNENNLQDLLKKQLPDYPKVEPVREQQFQVQPGKAEPVYKDFGCVGFKMHAVEQPHIVQFNRAFFLFSRMKPYEDWEHFSREALRLWAIYREVLRPSEIRRVGLRFINRIAIKKQGMVELGDYYTYPPEPLKELRWPLSGYLHHDMIQVPETKYSVNLIKTVQNTPNDMGLILDIDVFMQSHFVYNELRIIECMEEMRWIKNKVFFGSLTKPFISGLTK